MAGPAARHAVSYAFVGLWFWWAWYPLLNLALKGKGATASDAGSLTIFAYVGLCVALGYRKARSESRSVSATTTTGAYRVPASPTPPRVSTRAPAVQTGRPTGKGVVVGSSIRLIYHSPYCKWAQKISSRNRVTFSSSADARAAGYRACSVCSP